MRTINFNLVYVIIFISFCCFIAIGSPPSEAEHIAFSQDSKLFPAVIKEETWPLTVEEILSPKKYLKRYLAAENKEGRQDKPPDRECRPDAMEKEIPSTDGVIDVQPSIFAPVTDEHPLTGEKKGTQTPTVNNVPLQVVKDEKAPSSPVAVKEKGIQEGLPADGVCQPMVTGNEISAEKQKTDVHSLTTMSGSDAASAIEQQSPAVEKGITQAYTENNKPLQPVIGKEPPSTGIIEEKTYHEKSLIDDSHQPTAPFSETIQESKEENTPTTITTPEFHSEIIAGGEPLQVEAIGTQTPAVGNKSLITTDENGTSSTPTEKSSYMATEKGPDVLMKEAKESEKKISSPASPAETGKEAKELKPSWGIWHNDPTHNVILAVAITLIAAKIGGWLARKVKFSEVVGNLIIGIILGNIFTFTGWDFFHFLKTMPFIKMISYFGTLILLFTVGLHVDLRALLQVGTSSLMVCLGGLIAPAGLGLMVGHFFLPDASVGTKLILAIILCNTATGLKLAVLKELRAINSLEGRVITGATVLTDIVVFLTFGVVSGFAVSGGVSLIGMSISFGIAIALLIISGIMILRYSEKFGNFLTKRMTEGANIPIVVTLSLLLAFMFGSIGLHTIMGAFVAGLFLRNVKLRSFDDEEHRSIESFIRPFYMILVPILFVRVGAQVDLKSFLNIEAVPLILAITGAAVIGKMFCSVCPIEKGINRPAIGLAMVMKMDGTLIVSGIARDMGMLNDAVFSSIIVVIVLTSTICPSLFKASLVRQKKRLSKNFQVTVDENTKEIFLRFKSEAQR